MRIVIKWKIDKNTPIQALAVDPVHDQVLIGYGKSIIMIDVNKGSEVEVFEKHTADITCLGFRKDGLFFASGGKDNLIYLWDVSKPGKPVNKITFNDFPLQINYNPCILTVSNFFHKFE